MSADEMIILERLGFALFAFLCALCSLLAGTLLSRHFLRTRRERLARNRPVTVFDTASVQPRLRQVRADFLTAVHTLPHARLHPKGLIEAARQAVLRLAYFHDRETEARK